MNGRIQFIFICFWLPMLVQRFHLSCCSVFLVWNVFLYFLHLTIAVYMGSFQDWILQTVLLWTSLNRSLDELIYQFLLVIYLRIGYGYVQFYQILCNRFSNCLYQSTLPLIVYKNLSCSMSLPKLGIFHLFYFSHSGDWCHFNLYFADD